MQVMKQFDEPFSSYWNGKPPVRAKKVKKPDTEHLEDDQYRALKKAIQKEAIRKWSMPSSDEQ